MYGSLGRSSPKAFASLLPTPRHVYILRLAYGPMLYHLLYLSHPFPLISSFTL